MTVVLRSRDDVTVDAVRRVAFAGEQVRWSAAQGCAATGATTGDRASATGDPDDDPPGLPDGARRRLPEYVSRAVAFALLARAVTGDPRSQLAERVAHRLGRSLPTIADRGLSAAATLIDSDSGTDAAVDGASATSSALGAVVAILDRHRLELAERVLALSIEAYRAPLDAYHPALGGLWEDPFLREALDALNDLVDHEAARQRHQAPVSYRIVPRLTGQVRRALAQLERVATDALRGPLAPAPEPRLAIAVAHDAPIAAAIDGLCAAWVDIGALAHRHVVRLARAHEAGADTVHVPTDELDELRRLAQPTLLGALEISVDPYDDVPALAPAAYLTHRRVTARVVELLAALAATASWTLERGDTPLSPAISGLREMVRGLGHDGSRASQQELVADLADAMSASVERGPALGG